MVDVDLEIDESKLWDPEQRQAHMDSLPDMTLFEDHIVQGDEMVEAIHALIEDGESAESLALHWKNQGNDMFSDAKKAHRVDGLVEIASAVEHEASEGCPGVDIAEDVEKALKSTSWMSLMDRGGIMVKPALDESSK
ncbi:hypothetical protein PsorP6_013506 [Peronosclerospora sorghi]|uniref:Uncharacterized protein n=1 Tax=Peronosclerospora sorghi TaxID=230839 RepID=A0ACC0VJH2_9STRA|nr:hypothetical protein PsorP6_013506 [Peronosclerospora sorghi]